MTNPTACRECGMSVEAGEYHPYAACLMFKGCHDSTKVRANLQSVVDYGNARPTAVASHAEGENKPFGWWIEAEEWATEGGNVRQFVRDRQFIELLQQHGIDVKEMPLYAHPARSGDEAMDAAVAVLRFAASVIELYDDATMRGDYMIDSGDCAAILKALADRPEAIDAAMAARGDDK